MTDSLTPPAITPPALTPNMPAPPAPARPRRRHRRLRWILAVLVALVVLIVAAVAVTTKLQPTPAPLALPAAAAAAPVGPLDGTWRIGSGSVAGFRVQQTVLWLTSDVVGRTADVTGSAVIAGSQVSSADVRVNLLALTSAGKPAPQFTSGLDAQRYPAATVSLAGPMILGVPFAAGTTTTATAAAQLTLHGVTRAVTVRLSAHRDGATVQVAGSIPVSYSDWGVTQPQGFGSLGSLADLGVAEFLLILHRN